MSPHDARPVDVLLDLFSRPPATIVEFREKYAALAMVAAATPSALVAAIDIYQRLLADVQAVEKAWGNQMLTYEEAERESGLGQKQLARHAASGAVDSEGSNRNRRFRRGSLPRKAGHKLPPPPPRPVAPPGGAPYDPAADARRLARQLDLQTRRGN